MNLLGNLIWIVFGGFIIFFEYIFGGIVLCLTIVGIPFGLQSFKMSLVALFPFGQEVVETEHSEGFLYLIMNVIWLIFGGVWIALSHLLLGVVFFITIIGIPFGRQHFKLAGLALSPFGKDIR